MTRHRAFRVGGHTFTLDFPNGTLSEKELMPYAPFQTDSYYGSHPSPAYHARKMGDAGEEDALFNLTLIYDKEELDLSGQVTARLEDENGKMTVLTREDGGMAFILLSRTGKECCRISISNDYRKATAWIEGTVDERRYALDTALMLLYTFASSNFDTLLVHASAVEYCGKGYLFLGKSGTGKSTHSRLWLEHITGSELLNDDNPIIRIIDGEVYVYGSPWSGKTPCHRNRSIMAGGIVRLHQAPFNKMASLSGIRAYAALLPACSSLKWDNKMAESVHDTIVRVIERVPLYSLECLPDREAALVCCYGLVDK